MERARAVPAARFEGLSAAERWHRNTSVWRTGRPANLTYLCLTPALGSVARLTEAARLGALEGAGERSELEGGGRGGEVVGGGGEAAAAGARPLNPANRAAPATGESRKYCESMAGGLGAAMGRTRTGCAPAITSAKPPIVPCAQRRAHPETV